MRGRRHGDCRHARHGARRDRAPSRRARVQLSADLSVPRHHDARRRHAVAKTVRRRRDAETGAALSRCSGRRPRIILGATQNSVRGSAMMQPRHRCLTIVLAWLVALATPALSDTYPSQPIRIVVPTPAGGIADLLSRTLANKMGESGKTVVVENRTGGSGVIAADAVAKSAPDGYTLYMGLHQTQAILPHLMAKLPYDPVKDFTPIILIGTSPNILVVNPAVPAKTAQELVAHAKANPGKVTYASPGNGSAGHIVGEQFRLMHGIDIVHVPYRGAAPALQDVVAGHISMMFDIVPLTREQLTQGKVRALAVAAPQRLAAVPDVPTMTEVGMRELEGGPWFGLLAPAGTPRAVIDWLNAETIKAFNAPDVRERLSQQGLSFPLGSPEDFATHIAAETQRWGDVIRRANIKMD